MTILLVTDDDGKLTDMLRSRLAYAGYDVFTTAHTDDALRLALAQPQCVMLGWTLSGMSGVEVEREVRHTNELPILKLAARDPGPCGGAGQWRL